MSRLSTLVLSIVLAAPCLSVAASCTVDRDVRLVIEGGSPGLVYELRVYEAPSCSGAVDRLTLEPASTDGSVHVQTFRAGEGRPVGALAPEPHCFAVIARTDSCLASAYGETVVDLAAGDVVTVRLSPLGGTAACGAGQTCVAGTCTQTPSADGGVDASVPCIGSDGTMMCMDPSGGDALMCCDSRCVDVRSDPNHCGTCGARCTDVTTPEGGTCCDGRCVDVLSDPVHCGACNTRCGSTCTSGVCGGLRTEILVELQSTGVPTDLNVVVRWFQWDGRDPDPTPTEGFTIRASTADGVTMVSIPVESIRPPESALYLCNRACTDELTCPCEAETGIGLGYVEATELGSGALLGRAPVIVVHVPRDGVDLVPEALGTYFSVAPPMGISVYEPASDRDLAPVPGDRVIRLPVCELPAVDACIGEPVTRPFP